MSTDLANTQKPGQLVAVDQVHDDSVFGEIASSGKWLPRLALYGANADAVKSGKIQMAHYGLTSGKDNIEDMGDMVDILPFAWRPKAMDISDKEGIVTIFDHTSAEFKEIIAKSEIKDSGCMYGPEFLVWIPQAKKFALLFMQSKTSRREAPTIKDRLGMPTTLKAEYIKTPKYSWHGIKATQCSTPFDLPTEEAMAEEVQRFNNPPKSETEKVEEVSPGRAR